MFNPSSDLNAIQRLLIADTKLMELLDLTGKPNVEIAKRIIKRSQWSDLATSDKRLCIYFVPSRETRNESFIEENILIDVHLPVMQDFKGWEIQERVKVILHNTKANKRYLKFKGHLGELPTIQGLFCCGSRFKFYRSI